MFPPSYPPPVVLGVLYVLAMIHCGVPVPDPPYTHGPMDMLIMDLWTYGMDLLHSHSTPQQSAARKVSY